MSDGLFVVADLSGKRPRRYIDRELPEREARVLLWETLRSAGPEWHERLKVRPAADVPRGVVNRGGGRPRKEER